MILRKKRDGNNILILIIKYLVIFEKSSDGSTRARVPHLDGCFSRGDTIDEAKENVKMLLHFILRI